MSLTRNYGQKELAIKTRGTEQLVQNRGKALMTEEHQPLYTDSDHRPPNSSTSEKLEITEMSAMQISPELHRPRDSLPMTKKSQESPFADKDSNFKSCQDVYEQAHQEQIQAANFVTRDQDDEGDENRIISQLPLKQQRPIFFPVDNNISPQNTSSASMYRKINYATAKQNLCNRSIERSAVIDYGKYLESKDVLKQLGDVKQQYNTASRFELNNKPCVDPSEEAQQQFLDDRIEQTKFEIQRRLNELKEGAGSSPVDRISSSPSDGVESPSIQFKQQYLLDPNKDYTKSLTELEQYSQNASPTKDLAQVSLGNIWTDRDLPSQGPFVDQIRNFENNQDRIKQLDISSIHNLNTEHNYKSRSVGCFKGNTQKYNRLPHLINKVKIELLETENEENVDPQTHVRSTSQQLIIGTYNTKNSQITRNFQKLVSTDEIHKATGTFDQSRLNKSNVQRGLTFGHDTSRLQYNSEHQNLPGKNDKTNTEVSPQSLESLQEENLFSSNNTKNNIDNLSSRMGQFQEELSKKQENLIKNRLNPVQLNYNSCSHLSHTQREFYTPYDQQKNSESFNQLKKSERSEFDANRKYNKDLIKQNALQSQTIDQLKEQINDLQARDKNVKCQQDISSKALQQKNEYLLEENDRIQTEYKQVKKQLKQIQEENLCVNRYKDGEVTELKAEIQLRYQELEQFKEKLLQNDEKFHSLEESNQKDLLLNEMKCNQIVDQKDQQIMFLEQEIKIHRVEFEKQISDLKLEHHLEHRQNFEAINMSKDQYVHEIQAQFQEEINQYESKIDLLNTEIEERLKNEEKYKSTLKELHDHKKSEAKLQREVLTKNCEMRKLKDTINGHVKVNLSLVEELKNAQKELASKEKEFKRLRNSIKKFQETELKNYHSQLSSNHARNPLLENTTPPPLKCRIIDDTKKVSTQKSPKSGEQIYRNTTVDLESYLKMTDYQRNQIPIADMQPTTYQQSYENTAQSLELDQLGKMVGLRTARTTSMQNERMDATQMELLDLYQEKRTLLEQLQTAHRVIAKLQGQIRNQGTQIGQLEGRVQFKRDGTSHDRFGLSTNQDRFGTAINSRTKSSEMIRKNNKLETSALIKHSMVSSEPSQPENENYILINHETNKLSTETNKGVPVLNLRIIDFIQNSNPDVEIQEYKSDRLANDKIESILERIDIKKQSSEKNGLRLQSQESNERVDSQHDLSADIFSRDLRNPTTGQTKKQTNHPGNYHRRGFTTSTFSNRSQIINALFFKKALNETKVNEQKKSEHRRLFNQSQQSLCMTPAYSVRDKHTDLKVEYLTDSEVKRLELARQQEIIKQQKIHMAANPLIFPQRQRDGSQQNETSKMSASLIAAELDSEYEMTRNHQITTNNDGSSLIKDTI